MKMASHVLKNITTISVFQLYGCYRKMLLLKKIFLLPLFVVQIQLHIPLTCSLYQHHLSPIQLIVYIHKADYLSRWRYSQSTETILDTQHEDFRGFCGYGLVIKWAAWVVCVFYSLGGKCLDGFVWKRCNCVMIAFWLCQLCTVYSKYLGAIIPQMTLNRHPIPGGGKIWGVFHYFHVWLKF